MRATSRIRRIVVATDFSPPAVAAYKYASELREKTGAELCVVHVIVPIHYIEKADAVLLARDACTAAEKMIASLKPRPARSIVVEGAAHQMIVETAHKIGADLIVVGTHGRTGVRRLMLGSVAENVLRHARCPVLTVRRS